jgi:hypothetical protein
VNRGVCFETEMEAGSTMAIPLCPRYAGVCRSLSTVCIGVGVTIVDHLCRSLQMYENKCYGQLKTHAVHSCGNQLRYRSVTVRIPREHQRRVAGYRFQHITIIGARQTVLYSEYVKNAYAL